MIKLVLFLLALRARQLLGGVRGGHRGGRGEGEKERRGEPAEVVLRRLA